MVASDREGFEVPGNRTSRTLQHRGVRFELAARTDTGLVRGNNEDCLILSEEDALFGVCDGMGGHAAGEIASSIASEAISEGVTGNTHHPPDVLKTGIESANEKIFQFQARRPECRGMGTTLSALWIAPKRPEQSWIAHVGDSRIYRQGRDGFRQITNDHSPVYRLYQQGMITREQMRRHPHKNLLDRSLGVAPTVEPDVFDLDIEAGDLILICTDGLTDELDDREIEEITSRGSLDEIADRLLEQAKATGGRDNITLVVLKVIEVKAGG